MPSIQINHAKKFIIFILNKQEKEINKSLEIFIKKKKVFFISILVKYVINAKIMLEIQVVHHDFKVIIEGF